MKQEITKVDIYGILHCGVNSLSGTLFVCLFLVRQRLVGHSRGFYITHNDASESVRRLWTSDQFVAETST